MSIEWAKEKIADFRARSDAVQEYVNQLVAEGSLRGKIHRPLKAQDEQWDYDPCCSYTNVEMSE